VFACTRFILRRADILFFTTRFQATLWKRAYGLTDERIHYLENYFPSQKTIQPPRTQVFVSAGRPIALKNYNLLERVFARLKEKHPGAALDTRRLPPEAHRARIVDAYAVIIPSVSEVSSNTAIDAVNAGKPFVMSSDTGTSERLGECGLFIDTRSEDELYNAIESLLDSTVYERHAHAAQLFKFSHSWDDIAREIISSLQK
jgi:glycosyltransferase involved in cell wall biosynthesis